MSTPTTIFSLHQALHAAKEDGTPLPLINDGLAPIPLLPANPEPPRTKDTP